MRISLLALKILPLSPGFYYSHTTISLALLIRFEDD